MSILYLAAYVCYVLDCPLFDTCLNQIGLAFMPCERLMLLRYILTPICPMVVFFYKFWSLIVVYGSSVHSFCAAAFLEKCECVIIRPLYCICSRSQYLFFWCLMSDYLLRLRCSKICYLQCHVIRRSNKDSNFLVYN